MHLDPQNVFVQLEAKTQEELFSKMGMHLLSGGFVKNTFVDALIEREKNFPTGLPGRDFGIAMPHVDPEHVLMPGVAVATLKNPIPFNLMGSKDATVDASIIFMLMLKSHDDQIEWLKKLMAVIQNHDLIADFISCLDAKSLYAKVKEVL